MIDYKELPNGEYELLQDYNEDGIKIKKGFVWDGCSIPPVVDWFITTTERTKEASMVHDFIYRGNAGLSRSVADKLFHKKLLEDNVKPLKAGLMKLGVNLFGFIFYKRNINDQLGIGD